MAGIQKQQAREAQLAIHRRGCLDKAISTLPDTCQLT